MSIIHDASVREWRWGWRRASASPRRLLIGALGFKLCLLDFAIALARKIAGFVALLALGWMYFCQLALGESLHRMFPGAGDPDLRQTMWVAFLLILAMGWDISNDQIAAYWERLHERLPGDGSAIPSSRLPALGTDRVWVRLEPVVGWLGRFMDLCVALANKIGALAVLGTMAYLGWEFGVRHLTLQQMYPQAVDPVVSLLADICVYVVVLAWWAMPIEQIAIFWRRLQG